MPRGRHKVFLGMAAGVGKTYRMLQEGRAELASGRDVAIGYLEAHGRAETAAQARGLEVVPRRRVAYRNVVLEEMDLPGVLARMPELCLIDELAHTNAPGLEHDKRYEDVEEVLDSGIDVFSTLNVQHLESLNDRVAELTETVVRETIPDAIVGSADEIVLVDLTPEALLERLQAGKVYPAERVPAALNNFFRIENLAALREVALRQVAEDVEAKRLVREPEAGRPERLGARGGSEPVGERVLALVALRPRSQRVVRRAWRSAQRLGAELDLLVVRPAAQRASAEERDMLEAMRRLAAMLGARLLVEEGDDVADVAARVARERGTTYLIMGTPARRSGRARLREPVPMRLLRRLPGVNVRIVADRPKADG